MATKPMFLVYEGGKLNEYVPPTPTQISKVYMHSQWVNSGTVSDRTLFKSNSNYHVANSVARCTVYFKGFSSYTLMCRSNGEVNYDYLEVGNLNVSNISRNGSNKISFKGNASASTYTAVTWTGLNEDTEYFVELIYSKDSSADSNEDRGFFYIPEGEVTYADEPTPEIYGVEWDGSSTTRWTRTDDAASFSDPTPSYKNGSSYTTGSSPFDTISPWKDMVTSERTGGTMVAIPKFYYKWTKTGSAMKLQIANTAVTGFSVSPAHRNRGLGEKDVIYVGRYHCASSTYKSTTGVQPQRGGLKKYRSTFRTAIRNLDSNIYMYDYACLETIWMLYLVEFADWNSQAKIGGGCSTSGSVMTMGYTDNMNYHTGTTASSIGATVYGGTQYRNIEGLWDNVADYIDGIMCDSSYLWAILNPSSYADITASPAVNAFTLPSSTSGWISSYGFSSATNFDWLIFPNALSGSANTYTTDYYQKWYIPTVGGYYSNQSQSGLFYLNFVHNDSDGISYTGSRIVEYP